jgi:predicted helicase
MLDLERILAGLKDWAQFETAACMLTPKAKGDLFALFTKHYLRLSPVYRTELSDVWLLEEVPQNTRVALKLPVPDKGIDLIAQTMSGEYWAIQCKYEGRCQARQPRHP